MKQLDPDFLTKYDPRLKSESFAFGFQTRNCYAHSEKSKRILDTALKIASYIPLFGGFFFFPLFLLDCDTSDPQITYRKIENRKFLKIHLETCRLLNIEPPKKDELEPLMKGELLWKSSPLRKRECQKKMEELKQFIRISPIQTFEKSSVIDKKGFWQNQAGSLKEIDACDRIIELFESIEQIHQEEQPKLEFLKKYYPGASSDVNEKILKSYLARMVLSTLCIGTLVLPIFDLIATTIREYRAVQYLAKHSNLYPNNFKRLKA